MSKHFKLRISRVITSFHSCRSKDDSILPQEPVPSFLRLSPANPKLPAVDTPATKPTHRSSFKRHVSSAFIGCGFGSKSPEFQWQKEEKWHVVAMVHDDTPTPRRKIYNSSVSGESDDNSAALGHPPPPPPPSAEKKKRRSKKKRTTPRLRMSTSSADSGLFSSEGGDEREEEDEESETLMSSSRSFSTDSSSEFNPQLKTITETESPISRPQKKKKSTNKTKRAKPPKRHHNNNNYKVKMLCRSSVDSPDGASPARLSVFKKLIPCTVDGKVRESYAVVKKSEDPFEDFKRSMTEMVLEKQIFEERELEQLLQCFLSLNSRQHHGVIVEAFAEIWEAMFCRNVSSHHRHQRV